MVYTVKFLACVQRHDCGNTSMFSTADITLLWCRFLHDITCSHGVDNVRLGLLDYVHCNVVDGYQRFGETLKMEANVPPKRR
jgi:hypothetical protein